MKSMHLWLILLSLLPICAKGEIKVVSEHHSNETASHTFKFDKIPAPSKSDAATSASFSIVSGERDDNGGELDKLHDGKLPNEQDEPAENFFFNQNADGGRLRVDLGKVIALKQVNTYSWHPDTRGPQVYKLYASAGSADGFNAKPARGTDPEKCGWRLIASVDTRPKEGNGGGQYGVSIFDSEGTIGQYRWLLFDILATEMADPFGNTFYSEIDVVDAGPQAAATPDSTAPASAAATPAAAKTSEAESDNYHVTINTDDAPDLAQWAQTRVAPMAVEWYPRIVRMLASEGFEAPKSFTISFSQSMNGVAATSGTKIRCSARWINQNLDGEALGAIFHEIVHVAQQYHGRAPGWLTEGIPDYLRWYFFEPQARGAEVRNPARARYDARYRPTANFLNWVSEYYNRDLVPKINAAIRQRKYDAELWKTLTGHTADELGEEWKTHLAASQAARKAEADSATVNTLTEDEQKAGWKLLFDGKSFDGWSNFKRDGVRPGWQVKDGVLVCSDPHNAGDIVSAGKFAAFELDLDYNISEAGNSGIMFHVSDEGGAVWASGPEFQLEDNVKAADPQRCGWLYALYQPPIDPKTSKPIDATKPVGEWNHVRLLISPNLCVHEINGVKYFQYVLGSDDFNRRVAKSKFARMPGFAKSSTGRIALQGDHGQVSFRNIKVRELPGSEKPN